VTGWTRHRATVLIVAGLVVAVAVVLIGGTADRRTGYLDPANPDPDGAQALARVLDDQGVDVTVVRDAAALEDADTDGATVMVTSTDQLGESTIGRLRSQTRDSLLVLVEPGSGTTGAFGISDLPFSVALDDPRPAGCTDPMYAGLSIEVDEAYEYPTTDGCFRGRHGSLVAEPHAGLVLMGAGEALTNDQVLRAENAAVVLRMLGQNQRLVWYVPTIDDLVGDDGVSLTTLLPDWLRPTLWLLVITSLALLLWRARRLGALASEPLPVVVKAIETTRSRGRLYRRAGDRAHAAAVLRSAARVHAADRLGLGPQTDTATVVRDLARRTGKPLEEVESLLGPTAPVPTTDHDLITLANRLAELDREVRRP